MKVGDIVINTTEHYSVTNRFVKCQITELMIGDVIRVKVVDFVDEDSYPVDGDGDVDNISNVRYAIESGMNFKVDGGCFTLMQGSSSIVSL